MEENKYTELDKLFQDSMGDQTPDGFDIPDEAVLEGALLQLDKKPKRRALWLLFLIGFIFLGALTLIFDKDKEVLINGDDRIVDVEPNLRTEFKQPQTNANKGEGAEVINALLLSKSEEFMTQSVYTEIVTAEKVEKYFPNEKQETQTRYIGNNPPFRTEQIIQETISVANIPAIGMNVLETEQRSRIKRSVVSVVEETKGRWSVSIFASALYTSFTMSNGNGQLVEELIDYDKYYLGYRGGIELTQQVANKLDLAYQLSYAKINNESSYESDMNYQSSNEFIGSDGELMYSDQLTAQTPVGILSRDVRFNTENTGLVEDEKMQAKTQTTQSYQLLSLGASLNYDLAKIGPLIIQPTIGIRSSYLLGLDNATEIKMYHDDKMFFQEELMGQEKEMVNPLWFSGELGMNLSFKFSKKIITSLSFGYEQNFNSLRKTSPLDITKTNYNSIFLGLKSSFTF